MEEIPPVSYVQNGFIRAQCFYGYSVEQCTEDSTTFLCFTPGQCYIAVFKGLNALMSFHLNVGNWVNR